eukprot:scaffold7936_cov116-Isochrysis_galbana.AAC.5
MTRLVYGLLLSSPNGRARPKSASLSCPDSLMRRFEPCGRSRVSDGFEGRASAARAGRRAGQGTPGRQGEGESGGLYPSNPAWCAAGPPGAPALSRW